MDEAGRVAEQINSQWPFIPVDEAKAFYVSLGHIGPGEGSVRISLWVLKKVLDHENCPKHGVERSRCGCWHG